MSGGGRPPFVRLLGFWFPAQIDRSIDRSIDRTLVPLIDPCALSSHDSTLWERKIRTDKRRVQTPNMDNFAQSSTEELRNLLKINEGSIGAFEAVADELIK